MHKYTNINTDIYTNRYVYANIHINKYIYAQIWTHVRAHPFWPGKLNGPWKAHSFFILLMNKPSWLWTSYYNCQSKLMNPHTWLVNQPTTGSAKPHPNSRETKWEELSLSLATNSSLLYPLKLKPHFHFSHTRERRRLGRLWPSDSEITPDLNLQNSSFLRQPILC